MKCCYRNIPLNILSVDSTGKGVVNKAAVLEEREKTFELDTTKPFKLNAETAGVCESICSLSTSEIKYRVSSYRPLDRVLYTPERVAKIAAEAAKPDGTSVFSLNDRIGLVHDAIALSKAGLAKLSSALTLLDGLKGETECQSRNPSVLYVGEN